MPGAWPGARPTSAWCGLLGQQRVAHLRLRSRPPRSSSGSRPWPGRSGGRRTGGTSSSGRTACPVGRPAPAGRCGPPPPSLMRLGVGQRVAERVGRQRRLGHRVGHVDAAPGEPLHHLRSGSSGRSSDTNWNTPATDALQRIGDDRQLVVDGEGAGHVAVLGAVQDRARRREAQRAGAHAVGARPSAMLGDLVGAEVVLVGPLAEHVGRAPRRGAPGCRGRWCGAWPPSASRYWPKVSHCQSMPSCSAVPGMSSTPSMSSIRKSSRAGPHRREADAAVAHDRGGHAVAQPTAPARRPRWPGRRSGCGRRPSPGATSAPSASISRRPAAVDLADLDDLVAVDGDVGRAGRRAGAVDDASRPGSRDHA